MATENSDSDDAAYDWTGGWRLRKQQMEEDLSRKNAQLNQLMDDIQRVEEEKGLLQATVTTLQTSLTEANQEIDGLASDYTVIRETNQHMQERLLCSQEGEAALRGQLEESLQLRQEQEESFVALHAALEARLDKLQEVLLEREKELVELKELRLTELQQPSRHHKFAAPPVAGSGSSIALHRLQQELDIKNRDLSKLSSKLQEATKEIDKSAAAIAALQQSNKTASNEELKQQLLQLRKQLHQERQHSSRLKLQLVSAEEDAQLHARELSSVTENLRAYMSGEFSLADAVKELKASRSQLAQRDSQVAQLTAISNSLQIHVADLTEENQQLRSQLELEPRQRQQPPPGGASSHTSSRAQDTKKAVAALNKRIRLLEEDKINLKTEVYGLLREVSNLRGSVQITALEVPVREALTSLSGGLTTEVSAQFDQVKEAIQELGAGLQGISARDPRSEAAPQLGGVSQEAQQQALRIIHTLKRDIDALTEEAERSREQLRTQDQTLATYRAQFSSLLAEVSSYTSNYKLARGVSEDRSLESGQLDITDNEHGAEDDSSTKVTSESDHQTLGPRHKTSVQQLQQPSHQHTNISTALEQNIQAATDSQDKILNILAEIRLQTKEKIDSPAQHIAMGHITRLLEELFQDRKTVSKLLSEARDLQFDGQVMLRQVQANALHIDEIKEVYSTEQTEQNVAKWCQNFHKQRLANIELKEKVNLLTDESSSLKTVGDQKESQVRNILHQLNEMNERISTNVLSATSSGHVNNHLDFATIAVQTIEVGNDHDDSNVSRYVAENNDVLGQAITDLDKQRALNANLQRSLREKELTLISKEQFINKVKGEMKLYNLGQINLYSDNTISGANVASAENNHRDNMHIDHLKSKLEENKLAIFRYEMLLEKAHKEQQKETYEYKQELESVIRERDVSLKKVKELQLCLDSIPCRDNDGGQQQQSIFIDQIQSMSETIRLLEKQLSSARIEKTELDSKTNELERQLSGERSRGQHERDRQEVACKIKAQNLEQENKRLQEEIRKLEYELGKCVTQSLSLKQQLSENPSVLLTALVKKMREKLIEKENQIEVLENQLK